MGLSDKRVCRRKLAGVVLTLVVIAISSSAPFRTLVQLPSLVRISIGPEHILKLELPGIRAHSDQPGFLAAEGWPLVLRPTTAGRYTVEFRLFGLLPLRRVTVEVLPPVYVVPGGHSIGVLLHSHGVIVSSVAAVTDAQGRVFRPVQDVLVPGDLILTVNDSPVHSDGQLAELVNRAGEEDGVVGLEIRKRDGRVFRHAVVPARCGSTGKFRIGVWVRGNAAGVGTLTFFEPTTGKFAALGHVVTDQETGQPVSIVAGRLVRSTVTAVQPGRRGQPGEIIGAFMEEGDAMGTITNNSQAGIVGTLARPITNPYFPEPVRVGRQARPGPADMLTVVEGRKIRRFSAEILEIRRHPLPHGRLVVRVTDPELISRTGGIVQGMSGSPLIQNGELVGAITHVLVSDPSRGYAIGAEWMVLAAGLDQLPKGRGLIGSGPF
jgi:stage IV sporulation protein B